LGCTPQLAPVAWSPGPERVNDQAHHPVVVETGMIMTLPLGFLMKDVLFLVASFYLLKQDLTRAALEITPRRAT
jgi:hypothetical protein